MRRNTKHNVDHNDAGKMKSENGKSKKNSRTSVSISSESVTTSVRNKEQTSKYHQTKKSKNSSQLSDRGSAPGIQVVKQTLDSIRGAQRTHEVDATIQGEFTPQEVRDLKYVFDTFDSEHRGYIDSDDLRRALRVMGFKVTQDDLMEIMADVHGRPVTRRSEVTFQEFLELVIYKQADARDVYGELEQAFKMMDLGEKGHLTFEDIKKASQIAGLKFRDNTIRDMMDEADVNGDDLISKEEFFQVMLQTNLF